jgi:TRAP-type C4-dicarboxylate transport system permease small subunit
MSHAWRRWHSGLSELGAKAAALCVLVSALVYTVEVVARHFLAAPLNWSGDLSSYLLCACTFLALPKVTSEGGHVAVTYLLERTPSWMRRSYAGALSLVTAAVCAVTAAFVVFEGMRQFEAGVLTSQANQIPKWLLSVLACYGFASSALHLLALVGGAAQEDKGL